jgi:hypothetical protein
MFFKSTETCTSDSYTEVQVLIFEAYNLEALDDYYKDLHEYNQVNSLSVRIEILEDEEVDHELREASQECAIDVGE